MSDAKLNGIASQVIDRLKGQVIIHRYDAFSTNSIYLKFDYGVANSLRISDHPGKRHLRYRFNLILDLAGKKPYSETRDGLVMYFYPPEQLDNLVKDILKAKDEKARQYHSYAAVVKTAADKIDASKGFWSGAKEIR